jgi:hypothetical protein
VEYRALFRDIDLFAAEHGIDSLAQTGLFGELHEKFESFIGNSILRIIEIETQGLKCEALATLGIFGKKLMQMQL